MVNSLFELLKHLNFFWQNGQLPEWGGWTYVVLALLVAVEGPIATLLGAAAASAGVMRPWLVFLAASMGNLTADSLWYSIGYVGRLEWFLRFGRRVGISHAQLDRLQHVMRKHAARILFFAKLSMSLMVPSLIAAGLVKVDAVLTTQNGTPLGQDSKVTIRVQPPATWIYWVLGGLAGIVLVLGTLRSLRRGSTRGSRPDAQEPSIDD